MIRHSACGMMRPAILLIGLVSLPVFAQTPIFDWAEQAGGGNFDFGSTVASDGFGNVYIAGEFTGTASFGSTELTSVGDRDVFIAKLDPSGNWLWAVQVEGDGGRFDDFADGIAVDSAGSVYVTGTFAASATFGSVTLDSAGVQDMFVAKLNTAGNWLWATGLGTEFSDAGYGVAVDSVGSAYVTGHQFGIAFAAKLDTNGAVLWETGIGEGTGYGIAVDSLGDAYVTGAVFIDPTYEDAFITRIDTNGNLQWFDVAFGLSTAQGRAIATNGSDVYFTGYFSDIALFDGVALLPTQGEDDAFIARLDVDGNWQWARRAGGFAAGIERDTGYGVAVDILGDVYVTGYFTGEADFGPTILNSGSTTDAWVAKLDTDGLWLWVRQMGGVYDDYGFGIALDGIGVMYTVGAFNANASFDSTALATGGLPDAYIAQLSEPLPDIAAKLRDAFFDLDVDGSDGLDFQESGAGIRTFITLDIDDDNRITLAELITVSVGDVGITPLVFVNFANQGKEMGTQPEPFDTLTEAAIYVAPGGDIKLVPGESSGSFTLSGPMRLIRDGESGVVRIGAP